MNSTAATHKPGPSLKEGPVIYQSEDSLLDEERRKKDLTLVELNHIFKSYLTKQNMLLDDISILGQFSVLFNDPRFARWHTLNKAQQSEALGEQVRLPEVYGELIEKIGAVAGDAQIVKSVVKDAYQNAIDSFSHAAYLQHKYTHRFPGFKIILFLDQIRQLLILVVVDNGFGENISKPKKSYTGREYGDDFISRLIDRLIRRFIEKEKDFDPRIAYTGGQGLAMKKIQIELQLNHKLHFLSSGAIFELKFKNYF